MSFFDEFKNWIPYKVSIRVGKNKQFLTDPTKKNFHNYTGKLVSYYKKAETPDEVAKHGLGTYMTYLPADEVSLPIDISIIASKNNPLYSLYEHSVILETNSQKEHGKSQYSTFTYKKGSDHKIVLYNDSDKSYVGGVEICLTPAGDIREETRRYQSPDGTEKIYYTSSNKFEDGKVSKSETFEFKRIYEDRSKTIKIVQKNGLMVGCSITEEDLQTDEEIQYSPIGVFQLNEKTARLKSHMASCVFDETDVVKRKPHGYITWECKALENTLLAYQEASVRFQEYVQDIKNENPNIDFTIDSAVEFGKLPWEKQYNLLGFSPARHNIDGHFMELARFLSDANNNKLKDFTGDYIGNILKLTDKGYIACIVTKNTRYRFYTLIDFRGANIIQEAEGLDLIPRDGDEEFYRRLAEADKTPTFTTRINENGKEELYLYKGAPVDKCPQYETFLNQFIHPLSEIKSMQIDELVEQQKGNFR